MVSSGRRTTHTGSRAKPAGRAKLKNLGSRRDDQDDFFRSNGHEFAHDIEPDGNVCKLTVVHEFFEPGTVISTMVSQGWPQVIAALKTLLETGDVLSA